MSDHNVPIPRPFQAQGIDWLVGRRYALLADTMGLGKSMQAIIAADRIGAERVLIVAPKATMAGWQREIALWTGGERSATVVMGGEIPATGWVLLPWSRVVSRVQDLIKTSWDVLVVDEAHYAKSGKGAKRATAALGAWSKRDGAFVRDRGLVDAAERVWMLTGTPMPNRPIELHPLLQALQVDWARSKEKFGMRYCKQPNRWAYRGYDFEGAQNLDELNEKLTSTIMLRRTPEMVPGQLPEIVRETVALRETRAMRDVEAGLSDEARSALMQWTGDTAMPAFEEMSAYRCGLGLAKVSAVAAWVEEWLAVNVNESIVVFGHHQKVLDDIADALGNKGIKTIVAHGGNAPDADYRQSLVDRFAEGKEDIRVFLGSTGACGTGMNGLHKRAHVCAFAEPEWTPGEYAQAEGRIRRLGGQDVEQAIAIHLVVGGALEEHIVDTVTVKIEHQSDAIDGADATCLADVPMPPSDIVQDEDDEPLTDDVPDPATLEWTWRRCRRSGAWLIAVQHAGPEGEEWAGAEVTVRRRSGEEQRRVLLRREVGGRDWSLWCHDEPEPTEQERTDRRARYVRRRAEGRGFAWPSEGDQVVEGAALSQAEACVQAAARLTAADPDRAAARNADGWSAADTTLGRCLASIPPERYTEGLLKFAIRTLRTYRRTQIADLWPRIAGEG
ncbi:MAG: SNF2-related protein [Actinomycetota bacterium]